MQPEIPQPLFSGPPVEPPKKSRKKVIIIVSVLVLLLGAGVAAYFVFLAPKPKVETAQQQPSFKPIKFGTSQPPLTYAGHAVHDACNLIPLSVIEKHVDVYKGITEKLGSDDVLEYPVKMDHGYFDRSIPSILGDDGTPRDPSIQIGETGIDSTVRAQSFMSISDSYCMYGQGDTMNYKYAEVYIIQPPQPLHPKLLAYLDTLKQQGKLIAETLGVQAYAQEVKEGDDKAVLILKKDSTVVFLASSKPDILGDGGDAVAAVLGGNLQGGPMTATYPEPYQKLINPCTLFTAGDFEQLLGKQADSITTEELWQTEVKAGVTKRNCTRFEIERLREGEVTNSHVALLEAKTEDHAKRYMNGLKEHATLSTISGMGDEAVLVEQELTKNRKIAVRKGKQIIEVVTGGETKDATLEAFRARTIPVVNRVLENLNK